MDNDMKWIRVEDRLPELITDDCVSQDVLAFCVSHGKNTEWGHPNTYEAGEKYVCIDCLVKWNDRTDVSFRTDCFYGKVTHWMPLPKGPKL